MTHQRSYEWTDPATVIRTVGSLSGSEVVAGFVSGSVPATPAATTLGVEVESAGEGKAVLICPIAEWHCNTAGVVNGGLVSAMADNALGLALLSVAPPAHRQTTLDLHVRFVRAIPINVGRLKIIATVQHAGKRTGVAECVVVDDDETVFAHGTCSNLFYPAERRS